MLQNLLHVLHVICVASVPCGQSPVLVERVTPASPPSLGLNPDCLIAAMDWAMFMKCGRDLIPSSSGSQASAADWEGEAEEA